MRKNRAICSVFLILTLVHVLVFVNFDESLEQNRNDEEGEERRDGQSEDYGAAQSRPHLIGKRDWNNTGNGANWSDKYRLKPWFSGINNRLIERNAAFQIKIDFVDQDNCVFHHDAEKCQDSNQTRETQWNAEYRHSDEYAY